MGKTLEFLLQEMGREVNTIGLKANDAGDCRAGRPHESRTGKNCANKFKMWSNVGAAPALNHL